MEEERKAQQATGVAAREAYQQLQPSYEQAYKQAQDLLPGVQSKYETYQQTYNQAVGEYNTRLTQAKTAYESALQQGTGLESAYKTAQSGLGSYSSRLSQASSAKNQAYSSYSSLVQQQQSLAKTYTDAQKELDRLNSVAPTWGQVLEVILPYNELVRQNQAAWETENWTELNRLSPLIQKAYTDYKKQADPYWAAHNYRINTYDPARQAYQSFDTSKVNAALSNYQSVVQNTYNPVVAQYNQYVNQTLNPAAKAYQNFLDSGALNQAYQSYANISADKAQIDRASQSARTAYESSLQEYQKLQAEYQGLEPQLTEYTTQMQTAAGRIKEIQGELPALQKSIAVEQDPQKRETRVGYGRSLLTGGTKRASSAR